MSTMINEGRGISDSIKEEVDKIYNILLDKSYSVNKYVFNGIEITINFNKINNYHSSININENNDKIINIGIPDGYKERRVKEIIAHELTHLVELLHLGNKKSKYDLIKKSLMEFNPKTKELDTLSHIFYLTLDNEINANIAQTYIYLKGFKFLSKSEYTKKLNNYIETIEYMNIINFEEDILINKIMINKLCINELYAFNNILISNGVKTPDINNINTYVKKWFKIFNRKAKIFLIKQYRIIDEVLKDYKKFEGYTTEHPNRIINYDEYLDSNLIIDIEEYIKNEKH
jgi:hypothetical protein